jgi:hypothetical protein
MDVKCDIDKENNNVLGMSTFSRLKENTISAVTTYSCVAVSI